MKSKGIKYEFSGEVWKYDGPAGWYFISLPKSLAKEIRENLKWQEEGWGRLKAIASVGGSEWSTAIWFDTKKGTYLLPIKSGIRTKEGLVSGTRSKITIWV